MNVLRRTWTDLPLGRVLRSIRGVDPTPLLAAFAGAVVVGGAVLAWAISDRRRLEVAPRTEPGLPPGVAAVVSVLRSSAIVVNQSDVVLRASAEVYALGLVRGQLLANAELGELVEAVRRDGQIRETELVVTRHQTPARNVTARIAPLNTKLTLVLVEDRTRERLAEAARRDFVANVSHELKTPVGAIQLLVEATSAASDDPGAVRRFTGRMRTESERLTRLVQQIIELSRLQGEDPLDIADIVNVDAVLEVAVDTTAIDAEAKQITVVIKARSGLQVRGSRQQIAVAVTNLVANAVRHSSPDSSVLVKSKAVGSQVEISVVDQGIGIAPEELERIFERFYRVDPARHRSTGGTGLGLSIVKHVAAIHGGDVRVWSAEGQGSTFTLTLPRYVEEGSVEEVVR